MKLIVQIPCLNEVETLGETIAAIPRIIPGFATVEVLVIDDGSTDGTAAVALSSGADHVVRHSGNRGLAAAFRTGMDAAIRLGADVIVNTDADGQYRGTDIPRLVAPIVEGTADIVIGDRGVATVEHFSLRKRLLQVFGNWVVRRFSGLPLRDAVSGFRAFSRDAALKLNVVSDFSYTIETIIQAANKKLRVISIEIETNPDTRDSRLFKSFGQFIYLSAKTLLRMYVMYSPLRAFFYVSFALMLIGAIPIIRFLFFFFSGDGEGHVQSLIIGALFVNIGIISFLMGVIGDLINFNRKLLESSLERVGRIETELARIGSVNTDEERANLADDERRESRAV